MKSVGLFIPDAPKEIEETSSNEFSGMTVAQLKDYADTNGIDLGAAKTKADIVTIIAAVVGDV